MQGPEVNSYQADSSCRGPAGDRDVAVGQLTVASCDGITAEGV